MVPKATISFICLDGLKSKIRLINAWNKVLVNISSAQNLLDQLSIKHGDFPSFKYITIIMEEKLATKLNNLNGKKMFMFQ